LKNKIYINNTYERKISDMNTSISVENVVDTFVLFAVRYDGYSTTPLVVFAILYGFIGIISLMLNGCLTYLFLSRKKLRTPSNLITSALIWNSYLLNLVIIPLTFTEILNDSLKLNHNYIAVRSYFTMLYNMASAVVVILVSLNRLRKVLRGKNRQSVEVSVLILVFIIAAVTPIIFAVILIHFGVEVSTNLILIFMALIIATLVTSYGAIIYKVRKSKMKILRSSSSNISNDQTLKKLSFTVHLIIGTFLLTTLPLAVQTSYVIYDIRTTGRNEVTDTVNDIHAACILVFILNSIINPLVYFYTQKIIRDEPIIKKLIIKLGNITRREK